MRALLGAGFGRVHGVDKAPPMLKAARVALEGTGELHEGAALPEPPAPPTGEGAWRRFHLVCGPL
jgi:hypothetical protein